MPFSGQDVYAAALRRAGWVQIATLDDLFEAAEAMQRVRPLSGENLATWTALKSKFLDPEQAAADSDKKANVYPWCKTYSIGLNLTF